VVPVAIVFRGPLTPVVAKAAKKAGEFFLECGVDGCAEVAPLLRLDRVESGRMGQ
jgi:hypothetical protein